MTVIVGLGASFSHSQNGMTMADMCAVRDTANRLNEVIIFRSTGPWAKRWIERGYPTKNFHVKGKSSDWGPHAGFVPRDGTYSKVGYLPDEAAKGSKKNLEGIHDGFANEAPLILTAEEIEMQLTKPEGRPPRNAIESKASVPGSKDLILTAKRSGDGLLIFFRAFKLQHEPGYEIKVYKPGFAPNLFALMEKDKTGAQAETFKVMTSNEVGAQRPMTGDYDLLAICPPWSQYGSALPIDIEKAGLQMVGMDGRPGATFAHGVGMDNVLDPSLHTAGTAKSNWDAMNAGGIARGQARGFFRAGLPGGKEGPAPRFQVEKDPARNEHGDMGNLTPRILRCINGLNTAMGAVGDKSALRRVHHNAESHRNAAFGALSMKDMTTIKPGEEFGDGFPFTVFQPAGLSQMRPSGQTSPVARYGEVCTIENLTEFKEYAALLNEAGYYVPKNWIWGMSKAPKASAAVAALFEEKAHLAKLRTSSKLPPAIPNFPRPTQGKK
jgi:hypothetical protein